MIVLFYFAAFSSASFAPKCSPLIFLWKRTPRSFTRERNPTSVKSVDWSLDTRGLTRYTCCKVDFRLGWVRLG